MSRNTQDLKRKGALKMPLYFRERQSVVKELSNQYKGSNKRNKGRLIDHLQTLTGFNRSYAARALRTAKPTAALKIGQKPKRSSAGRKCYYDSAVLHDLKYIWAILDFPAGKRLAPFLPEIMSVLENHGEFQVLLIMMQRGVFVNIIVYNLDVLDCYLIIYKNPGPMLK